VTGDMAGSHRDEPGRLSVPRPREELAWTAGIFDGEGHINAVDRKVPSHGRRGGRP
jgi:hypothetical protein